MKIIKVGIIGFGTIGSGVGKALLERHGLLRDKLGFRIELAKICDKKFPKNHGMKIPKRLLTRDFNDILDDKDIDIVVELIGGIHPAREIIELAIKKGKSVVTANKALLSAEGKHLLRLAREFRQDIGFEASVGGGIPIVKALKESFIANKIESIYGIINGTSNFILSKMEDEGMDFKSALKEAQSRGYAEKNPTLDISGFDSAHKLSILTQLSFGKSVSLSDIFVEGIVGIEPLDIRFALEAGYAVKLLAIAKRYKSELELRVHPTLVSKNHLLSNIKGIYNAIYVKGDLIGEELFYGEGAGKSPTTSAVISDIVDLAYKKITGTRGPNLEFDTSIKQLKKITDVKTRYYIRFQAIDKPGVLSAISNILGKHNISIASVIQKEKRREKEVPIIMMTHEANELDIRAALSLIDKLVSIKKKTIAIRIESL